MSQIAYQAPLFFPQHDAVSSDEYLLVINPDANIATDIRFFKNKVWELTGDFPSHYSQPHITIYNFLGFQQKEDHIKTALKEAVTNIKSSFIYLENFQSFEGSGTIYIAPKPRHYFSLLLKSLYPTLVTCNGINRHSNIYSSTEPHITVARGLKKEQFNSAWNYFKDRTYQNSFIAESIVLLRKGLLKNDNYKIVEAFQLK